MTYSNTLAAPARGQFEGPLRGYCADGSDWRAWNCGPTDAAFIDGFYHDRRLDIDYVRRLAAGECSPTTAIMVETMLDRLGIPSDHHYGTTISLIKSVIGSRLRPMPVAVYMSMIPDAYSGDTFNGGHWLVCCANSYGGSLGSGVEVMDSNAPSGSGGFHFIPDWALSQALMGDSVIPQHEKVVGPPWRAVFTPFPGGPRTGIIGPHERIGLWTPTHPGSPAKWFTNTLARNTQSRYDGFITYTWPGYGTDSSKWPIPRGEFLHGYDGAPKGYGVLRQQIAPADGRPW